jgi:DNA-damage-inducible protein J
MLHARIDPKLKRSAERVFTSLGLTTTEAIRLFLKQVELYNGLPFSVRVPQQETIDAMAGANAPSKRRSYASFRDLRERV